MFVRRCQVGVAVGFVLFGAVAGQAAPLEVSADANGVTIQTTDIKGQAPRFSYDESQGILTLEGSGKVLATMSRTQNGKATTVRAGKITFWTETERIKSDDLQSIDTQEIKPAKQPTAH